MDFWVDIAFAVLLRSVKNPAKRTELKRAFLKLRNEINTMYANDPDFQ